MRTLPLLAALMLVTAACENPFTDPTPERAGGFDFSADTTELALVTSAEAYTLERRDHGYETRIPFRFRNTTDRTIYVVNCNRIAPPSLEKRVGSEWVLAWSPVVPLCLSDPIVIPAGEVYQDTLWVFAGYEGSNFHPQFEGTAAEGTFRLIWSNVLWSFDMNAYPFGPEVPLELRTSNAFTLTVEP